MALSERISVSGTALSYILKECINSYGRQEGFLFGNVTRQITNHISDSRTDNARIEVMVNVTSMLPIPEAGLFYFPSGRIKEDILKEILDGVTGNVVGWYHFRQNNSLKPTLRERIISKGLERYFAKLNIKYFLCCSISSKQTLSNSTHTYTYRFHKVNNSGEMETLTDITNNLGEDVSGYKRTSSGDKNDPFNKAVLEATKGDMTQISDAVRSALEQAAADAAKWEVRSREVATEIGEMLEMLANHYEAKISAICKVTARNEERAVIEPLVESLASPVSQKLEPFDFVKDMLKKEAMKPSKSNLVNSCPTIPENAGDAGKEDKNCNISVGHKRIHSEGGAIQESSDKRNISVGIWGQPLNSHQHLPDP